MLQVVIEAISVLHRTTPSVEDGEGENEGGKARLIRLLQAFLKMRQKQRAVRRNPPPTHVLSKRRLSHEN